MEATHEITDKVIGGEDIRQESKSAGRPAPTASGRQLMGCASSGALRLRDGKAVRL
jgi:hypothetical protein